MARAVKPTRSYNASLRLELAQVTRERILDAARRLLFRGVYSQVTMEEIAREAGVAYQTLYSVFRTKLGVAEAIVDAGWPHVAAAVELLHAVGESPRPAEWLSAVAAMSRRIYEPCADLERFLRESGDVALLGRYRQARRSRYQRLQAMEPVLNTSGRLRAGLTASEAIDLIWSLSGPENYIELVLERGWTADRYQAWLEDALGTLVLTPPRRRQAARRAPG